MSGHWQRDGAGKYSRAELVGRCSVERRGNAWRWSAFVGGMGQGGEDLWLEDAKRSADVALKEMKRDPGLDRIITGEG